jgi:alkylhydroperoxidase/carboxymuconolactone decarboxylase family protein YurZ
VYIAIDCATTQLYVPGLKLHIRNAVKLGATPEEVMEVFELASLMGSAERDGWGRGVG